MSVYKQNKLTMGKRRLKPAILWQYSLQLFLTYPLNHQRIRCPDSLQSGTSIWEVCPLLHSIPRLRKRRCQDQSRNWNKIASNFTVSFPIKKKKKSIWQILSSEYTLYVSNIKSYSTVYQCLLIVIEHNNVKHPPYVYFLRLYQIIIRV